MASVELAGVVKSFGNFPVIHGLDLAIEDGSFTVFVGPSGCGKSTLLRMVAGLEDVSDGEVRIGGSDVTDADPVARGIAMVFQNYALYPHMSVRQNIGFPLRMQGVDRKTVAQRVTEAAEVLQLQDLLERKPAQLSGGQRQRVAIGRAIVRNPDVFLFDEPLSNLDAELRVSMRVEIAKLHKALGTTMIYVTHDQTEAMTLADKIVVLRAGRIEQVGSPAELYTNPATLFVAGFIGSPRMNFLKARYADGRIELANGVSWPVPSLAEQPLDILVGLRPEHFVPGPEGVTLPLAVDIVEYLGGTRYVYATLGEGQVIIEDRGAEDMASGQIHDFAVDISKALYFTPAGERLRPIA
ncbi:MAG: sn-glycerol-3-phosphate ABC transporter ATP-binding protein UgpC [Devosia sp.]|uniref:ABC transporter ATP-binding protein n=1 Tax=Devosia sp. TaxID=1871048 RepID=UPI001A08F594|nr:sn-glycerol-3-phosphate ABC transporter ATP-binding protein UgpC [Devosia sp.]MBF0680867.1 sn-glycerol-3-phosphate ABC transporter ATP-binding protein UgpC [Devosia sp.]